MALSEAMWRGRADRQLQDHERWLTGHDQDIDEVRKDIGQIQQDAAAHRARVAVLSGIGGVVGACGGTFLAELLVKAITHG